MHPYVHCQDMETTEVPVNSKWIKKTQCVYVHTYRFAQSPSRGQLFETPWTVARQVPLSVGSPRQEYWSGEPFPSPGSSQHRDGAYVS